MHASKGKRFLNYLLDMIALYITTLLLSIITVVIAGIFNLDGVIAWMMNISTLQSYSIGFCMVLLYYGILETTSCRTFGKLITGTKVVMAQDGTKPTPEVILKRSLCRLIPFEAFSFFGETGWHDSISRTVVVNVKDYNAALESKRSISEIGETEI